MPTNCAMSWPGCEAIGVTQVDAYPGSRVMTIVAFAGKMPADWRDILRRMEIHAAELGCNVIDSAINYRFQRSERAIGAALKQLFDAANEKGVDRILVDCLAMSGELSTSDRYDLGAKAAAYSQREKSNKKLAIVGLPPTINGFAVEVAQNRGLATAAFTRSHLINASGG